MTTRTEALILAHFAGATVVEPAPTCSQCHDTGEVLALIINLGVDGERWHSLERRPCTHCQAQEDTR